MLNNNSNHTAIIGAGITGLSLAYYLLKKGEQVTLFEKEPEVGGLIRTLAVGGTRLERFYHHFFVQDEAAFALIDELGLKDRLVWAEPKIGFYAQGRLYPFSTPFDLLRFRPLSLLQRIKLGLFSLKQKKRIEWKSLEKITARDWLVKELDEKTYQLVWQPLLRGKFGKYADQVPATFIWSRLKDRSSSRDRFGFKERLAYLSCSYQMLVNALVERITRMGGEIRLNTDGSRLKLADFDRTVVTTPAAFGFQKVGYLANICLVLELKRPFSDLYWTNIGDASLPFCVMVEQTNGFDQPEYQGRKLLYVSAYLDTDDQLWSADDQQVLETFNSGLKRVKPGFDTADIIKYHVFRAEFAQPVPRLDHARSLPQFKAGDKLFYLTNAQIYPQDRGVNNSIKLAWQFAEL
ncbi:MAG: NAD(P)/FAD-dependent oxidoreductase [Candidatus Saganbacteria bacterium]|nr:NAD(P)/FAD-dependent oxidoreductase [Candidatus Saganbacteria bacterium]